MRKILVVGIIVLFIGIAVAPISAINNKTLERGGEPIDITVHEAWELLNDTSNGIQIPIDIRSEEEWNESFIDTPWPEHPRWHGNGTGLQEFMDMYDGEDVIIYCKGGYRSLIFCNILCEAGFNGTIYNMIGGITAWIEEGYPIRNNTPPEAPKIKGPNTRAKPITGQTKNFKFTTIDPDDDKIYLFIDWDDGTFEEWIGPYESGEEVTINHTYIEQGDFTIKAKAKDIFDAEGPWGFLTIPYLQSRQMINSILIRLLEHFPLLERLLNVLRWNIE